MHIIIGNFGNHSIAAMQMLLEQAVADLHFVYVETGWANADWLKHAANCVNYAKSRQIIVHKLVAQPNFSNLVIERAQFPSPKFPWCAGFLKGLIITKFLSSQDPMCEAIIVSGKRRVDSKRYADLPEYTEHSEYYAGRALWYPLWKTDNATFTNLIKRAGFKPLLHLSLECNPCIYANSMQLSLGLDEIQKIAGVEERVKGYMFNQPIRKLCKDNASTNRLFHQEDGLHLQQFDGSCGSPWNCGE